MGEWQPEIIKTNAPVYSFATEKTKKTGKDRKALNSSSGMDHTLRQDNTAFWKQDLQYIKAQKLQ